MARRPRKQHEARDERHAEEAETYAKEKPIEVEGTIAETLPNAMFRVNLEGGNQILAQVSGKIRMNFIKILPGDRVKWNFRPMT